MKKIYIILMHTNTLPAKLIRIFTRYKYSHVGISLDRSCDTIYSFGRKTLHNFMNSGFCIEYKNGEFFKLFNKTTCKIFEIEVTNDQYQKTMDILSDMTSHSDLYKYDFWGLIPRYFGIPFTCKNRYVCSYFVAYVLEQAGICHFDKETCLMFPKDFANLKELREIYKGQYLEYK